MAFVLRCVTEFSWQQQKCVFIVLLNFYMVYNIALLNDALQFIALYYLLMEIKLKLRRLINYLTLLKDGARHRLSSFMTPISLSK